MLKEMARSNAWASILVATACGGEPEDARSEPLGTTAADISTTNRIMSCVDTNSGRAAYKQSVMAELDANDIPHNIQIFRGPSAKLEHVASIGTLVSNYQNGYFERTYGLAAYSIGSEGTNDYYLLEPEAGITGATFVGQLHLWFNHGSYGWWEKLLSCTVQ